MTINSKFEYFELAPASSHRLSFDECGILDLAPISSQLRGKRVILHGVLGVGSKLHQPISLALTVHSAYRFMDPHVCPGRLSSSSQPSFPLFTDASLRPYDASQPFDVFIYGASGG